MEGGARRLNEGGAWRGCCGGGGGGGGSGGAGGAKGLVSTRREGDLLGAGLGWAAAGFAKGGGLRVILLNRGGKTSVLSAVVRVNSAGLDGLNAAELNGGGGSFLILDRIGENCMGLLRGGGGKKLEFGVMAQRGYRTVES